MIQKYRFKKPKNCTYFTHIDAFLIDSMARRGVIYGASATQFFVICPDGFTVCDLDEVPMLVQQMIPELRQEIIDIYEDIKDYKRMEVRYEKPMSSGVSRTVRNLPCNLQGI